MIRVFVLIVLLLLHTSSYIVNHSKLIKYSFNLNTFLTNKSNKINKNINDNNKNDYNIINRYNSNELIDKYIINNRLNYNILLDIIVSSNISTKSFNIFITKLIQSICKHLNSKQAANDIIWIIKTIRNSNLFIDTTTYTCAISSLIKLEYYNDAIEIFNEMKRLNISMDSIIYSNIIRALGHSNHWNKTIETLNEAIDVLDKDIINVAEAAMTNLNHIIAYDDIVNKAKEVYTWIISNEIRVNDKFLSSFLSVMCNFGTNDDISYILELFNDFNHSLTTYDVNTLLYRYGKSNDSQGLQHMIALINANEINPDIPTYNILLGICIDSNNINGAKKILQVIDKKGLLHNSYTKSLLYKLYLLTNDSSSAIKLFNQTSDSQLTCPMITLAILACSNDPSNVMYIYQRACRLNLLHEAIYTSSSKALANHGLYDLAYQVIDQMIEDGYSFNHKSLSNVLSICLQQLSIDSSNRVVVENLERYLQLVYQLSPQLITSSICQRVISELNKLNLSMVASQLHIQIFNNCTCKSATLLDLLYNLQSLSEIDSNTVDVSYRMRLGRLGLAIIRIYHNKSSILTIHHYNHVIRLLSLGQMYKEIVLLFRSLLTKYPPTTFTIAELIRCAKQGNLPLLAYRTILWCNMYTYVPFAVISDAISFVYSTRRLDYTVEMYRHMYQMSQINHWVSTEEMIIDLHNFSRGMAVSALTIAMKEISFKNQNNISSSVPLIVITGQSINRHKSNNQLDDESTSYLLLSELQDILIEDFYPPISSSTVPGNPGRLLVDCPIDRHNISEVCLTLAKRILNQV